MKRRFDFVLADKKPQVETVCRLVLRNPITHINIDVDVEELVQDKRKCGGEVGENYNKPKSEDAHVPQRPLEKEKAIMDALRHFGMIS